ncbi:hypothetical protein HMPREF0201_02831 [Cedecea davisae DSM 4568]|uniref:Uncharacterized protein n=1 Tax=Cedecea davisae DSM 4568 TaxID=566551 RepID=S3IRQ0_9ENTR|nr:hypothetical protein HMPREF0201_02831 [Cedecea davisae DSM 4568]
MDEGILKAGALAIWFYMKDSSFSGYKKHPHHSNIYFPNI